MLDNLVRKMLPIVMTVSNVQTREPGSTRRRFSLRFLFVASFALTVPFLVGVVLRDSIANRAAEPSPVFVIFGIVGVLSFFAVGHALASRLGALVAAAIAAGSWLALIVWAFLLHDPLTKQIPLHVAAICGTLLVILVWHLRRPEGTDEESGNWMQRLLLVKRSLDLTKSNSTSDLNGKNH